MKDLKAKFHASASIFLVAIVLIYSQVVIAAPLTTRSITLGSSAASASTTHKYDFTVATTGNVGSIIFEYCTTASGSCTGPTGLDVDSVTLDAQTGATGFVVDATETTTNKIVIDRTPASVSASAVLSYTFGSAVNSSTANETFFVRVSTTDAADGGGSTVDTGVVAGSTAAQPVVTIAVNETLTFCIYTGANCAAGGTAVSLGTASPSSASSGTNKMDASTNASGGYAITVNGATLTSGANTITAITAGSGATSSPGSEQFGLNLRDNTSPNVGTDPSGDSGFSYGTGYGTIDSFKFVSGNTVTSTSAPTLNTTYTAAYIANISATTEPGTYQTTLTYICTATF